MYWQDEGFLLSKNNLGENSIIIEAFTLHHGKNIVGDIKNVFLEQLSG